MADHPGAYGRAVAKAQKRFRLVAVETHPIQYKAPLFRALSQSPDVDLMVFYAMLPNPEQQGSGFGVSFAWDMPLLDGYRYEVLENKTSMPSVTSFSGCDTPGIHARLKQLRPDAVLVNGWVVRTCLQALWSCRRLGIPCMVRGEANALRPRAWWKHTVHRLLLSQYSANLYIGSANRDFYRSNGCREDRLFFAPYAVDNDHFARQAAARAGRRAEIRAALGIPANACVFLFAGKLEDKKRPGDVLKAMASIPPDARVRAHVLMVGDGPLRESLHAGARSANLPVAWAGFLNQSEMPDAYAAADVLVLPSDAGETWGLVVNEAMASGRPALVSRAVGCCADLVEEGETGFAFSCGDTAELAQRMARYLADTELAVRQGAAAARRMDTFCIARAVDGIVAALLSLSKPTD